VADKGDLIDGDVITAVDGHATPDFEAFKKTMSESAGKKFVLLSVLRGKDRKLALLDMTETLNTGVPDTLKGQ
jgi:hypothetical protein